MPIQNLSIINQHYLIYTSHKPEMNQDSIELKWNNITVETPCIIKTSQAILTIALSPNGKYIASAGGKDFSIQIWDPLTGNRVGNALKGHKDWIQSINYSKCGNFIVSCSNDLTIRQWTLPNQKQKGKAITGHESDILIVDYTHDDKYLVSCSWDQSIRFWSLKTGNEYLDKRFEHNNPISGLSLSPITSQAVFGDTNGSIIIWNYNKKQQNGQSYRCHSKFTHPIKSSSTNKLLISVSDHNQIVISDLSKRKYIRTFTGHASEVKSVNFSPDLKYIISGGTDKTVRIWNLMTGKEIGSSTRHQEAPLFPTLFSICGKYIITGGFKTQIMITPIN